MAILDTLNAVLLTENILSYIVLIVFALLVLVVGSRIKYGVLIAAPVGLLAGVYWLVNGLGWHFIVLLFSSIAAMILTATKGGK